MTHEQTLPETRATWFHGMVLWGRIACLPAFIALAAPVQAHEFWIDPDDAAVEPGQAISAEVRVGQDLAGDSLPFVTQIFKRITHRSPEGTSAITARLGDRPAIRTLELQDPGLHLIAIETNPSIVEFDTLQQFVEYLEYEGLGDFAEKHLERGLPTTGITETFARNARALIQVGPPDQSQTDTTSGMPFEIIALENPFLPGRGTLEVEVLWRGAPAENVQVSVFFLSEGGVPPANTKRRLFRTNASGRALIDVSGVGQYLLNAVHLEPVEAPRDGMWKSHWASLTFEKPSYLR